MAELTVEIGIGKNKKEYKMSDPEDNFEVYGMALDKYFVSRVKAGSILFDACYKGSAEELIDIKKNSKLYGSICLYVASYIEVLEGDLKKN